MEVYWVGRHAGKHSTEPVEGIRHRVRVSTLADSDLPLNAGSKVVRVVSGWWALSPQAVLVEQDFADIFLPFAKCLKCGLRRPATAAAAEAMMPSLLRVHLQHMGAFANDFHEAEQNEA